MMETTNNDELVLPLNELVSLLDLDSVKSKVIEGRVYMIVGSRLIEMPRKEGN